MVKLSERLAKIVSCIGQGDSVADIGTDHGLLPIFLCQKNISSQVILSDINEGPLIKAEENIRKFLPGIKMDLRLGDGLSPIDEGECNCAVIAGMGGKLIINILEKDIKKASSFKKLILQPRNAQKELREWLDINGFNIIDEHLAREGNYICEITVATKESVNNTLNNMPLPTEIWSLSREISPLLLVKKDPLLPDFIRQKIRIDRDIIAEISCGGGGQEKLPQIENHSKLLEKLLEMEV